MVASEYKKSLLLLAVLNASIAFSFTVLPIKSRIHASHKNVHLRMSISDNTRNSNTTSNSQKLDRRSFLTTSTTSALAGGILTTNPSTSYASSSNLISSNSVPSFPPMGIGAWAWGDSVFWGYDKKNDQDLRQVFDYAVEKNVAFFDTAELYGIGRSETLLGQFRETLSPEMRSKIQISTKFAALPWRTKPQDVVKACKDSLQRLGEQNGPIDLYLIHFPNAWSNAEYWEGLGMCVDQGLVRSVGVSNYGKDALRAAHSLLKEKYGIPLSANQIQMSLLYRYPLENGLLDTCNELDVKVFSYSPLALGFLTGKYSKENLPSGPRKKLGEKLFGTGDTSSLSDLLSTMKNIAGNHDASISQVALNWARGKGTIPIPGARTLRQAKENIQSLEWNLSSEEMAMLDEYAAKVPNLYTPDTLPFPKKDINTGLVMIDS